MLVSLKFILFYLKNVYVNKWLNYVKNLKKLVSETFFLFFGHESFIYNKICEYALNHNLYFFKICSIIG